MAFNKSALQIDFGRGNYGPGPDGTKTFRRATYITGDSASVVEASNYFNAAASRLPKGTVIQAVLDADGTVQHKNYIVSNNTGTVVTIKLQKTSSD